MNAEILKAVGPLLAHCTPSKNLPSIKANGLLPAARLAKHFNIDPNTIALRNERKLIQSGGNTAQLNHQKPILHGLNAANKNVEGHDALSWAKQLDQRVFFWPQNKGKTFAKSIASDVAITTLWIDTAALLETFPDDVWLSPINSGNFTQGGAHAQRGDWIYVPAKLGMKAFRENRQNRGLVKNTDTVKEISLTRSIPNDVLKQIIVRQ